MEGAGHGIGRGDHPQPLKAASDNRMTGLWNTGDGHHRIININATKTGYSEDRVQLNTVCNRLPSKWVQLGEGEKGD